MNSIRPEQYQKMVIQRRSNPAGTMYLRHWGGIGDHMYFLTFVSPFLIEKSGFRRILAADVSPRYHGDPLLEICVANGLIDELWQRTGWGAGPAVYPQEYIDQAQNPRRMIELYEPAIHYDKFLVGPGVLKFPVERLRQKMRTEERYLVPITTRRALQVHYPQLSQKYSTLQPYAFVQHGNDSLSDEMVAALGELGRQLVIMVYPTERRVFGHLNRLATMPHVTLVPVSKVVDSLAIQHYAELHIGIESSQILGAAIQGVPTFYWPRYPNSLSQFRVDLGIGDLCYPVPWSVSPRKAVEQIQRCSMLLSRHGAVRCCRQMMELLAST